MIRFLLDMLQLAIALVVIVFLFTIYGALVRSFVNILSGAP
jgi:hypothetical protein